MAGLTVKMKIIIGLGMLASLSLKAQVVTTNPLLPRADQPLTITVDVSGTSLDHFAWDNTTAPVWIWTWIENGNNDIDAPTNIDPATSPGQDGAKCKRIGINPDTYQITFTPTVFFNQPANELKQIGLKLKSRAWADNKQTDNDRFITLSLGFDIQFSAPVSPFLFVDPNTVIPITAISNELADITLTVNNIPVATALNSTTLNYAHTVVEPSGHALVIATAVKGSNIVKADTFTYIVRTPSVAQVRPPGVLEGINYSLDQTKSTLCLLAPGKSSVYVLGDFNGWMVNENHKMKSDGEYFWLELTGLTSGVEYGFQYLVDETLRIADPYSDKILDPEDAFIPSTVYPNLKPYPSKALSEQWYFNRVSVLQTGQSPFAWQANGFVPVPKENLVIYELLIRDFFGQNERSYQRLCDTLSYFKKLGVSAIELMPIMEFNGNNSWGYNPTFMFAPDKYFGPKNKLKEFVDKCHQQGLSVILDIALNHQDIPNPYVMLGFDFNTFKPTPGNKWYNVSATHPYSVFFDMNHESIYTQKYVDTVAYYWLKEFKVDGFRFDLSKGFTQKYNPSDVNAWSAYDASRIALLKRMADNIWSHSPNALIILEHFGANTEEKELAEYRAGEGKGMLLWGNINHAYNQNTMGYPEYSDLTWGYYKNRAWNVPHLVSYMESHDEERLMYRNLQYGNAVPGYSVKNQAVALDRMKGAELLFYTVPGPKMLWQFGEFGYDISINACENGTVNPSCRLSPKPLKWNYLDVSWNKGLYDFTVDVLRLRKAYPVFTRGDVILGGGNTTLKQMSIRNIPYTSSPANENEMNVKIVVNFDVLEKEINVDFPHAGRWYDYYNDGASFDITGPTVNLLLSPGRYKLFTDYPIKPGIITGLDHEKNEDKVFVYPNPVTDMVYIISAEGEVKEVSCWNTMGQEIYLDKVSEDSWYMGHVASGMYIVKIITAKGFILKKIAKD